MNDSYKKRLYTQALSLSAAVLMAVLAQGKAAADQRLQEGWTLLLQLW